LQLNSFVQYDTQDRTFGTNTRLRWTFHPRGDLFLIYNHNLRELGEVGPFDRTLESALVSLLQVPVIDGEVAVVPQGAMYQYADARLERLRGAQKQLLRMGPQNVRVIQAKLRAVASALGIPKERLPS
jgi:hypothetical protein